MKISNRPSALPAPAAGAEAQAPAKPVKTPKPAPAGVEAAAGKAKVDLKGQSASAAAPVPAGDARAANTLGFEIHTETAAAENAAISSGKFDQSRSMMKVAGMLPGLTQTWAGLPKGSVVLDLGSGTGFAIGTAVAPERYNTTEWMYGESKEAWGELAQKLGHLNFVGVTATAEQALSVPTKGERHQVFAGTFFADVPAEKVLGAFNQKAASAYDVLGVFAYSSTPDQDLAQLHALTAPGAKTFIHWDMQTAAGKLAQFQLPDGSLVDMEAYIQKYFGDAFSVESVFQWPSHMLVLTTKDGPPPRAPPVEMMHTDLHGTPPTRTFRVLDPALTSEQRAANELKLWDAAGVDHRFALLTNRAAVPDGPWRVRNPQERREWLKAPKDVALAMLQEETLATYGAFSKATVALKDPFWHHKMLAMIVSTGDLEQAAKFLEANRSAVTSRSPLDVAFSAVLDLAAGRTDTEAVRELERHVPPAGVSQRELAEQAARQGSRLPVTLESLMNDLRSGAGAAVLPDSPGDPSRQWQLRLEAAHAPVAAEEKTSIASAFAAVDALKLAVRLSPVAQEWLKGRLGGLSL
jgi:hypothetical protein